MVLLYIGINPLNKSKPLVLEGYLKEPLKLVSLSNFFIRNHQFLAESMFN